MRVAISGTREVSREDSPIIEDHMMEVLSERPAEILFGGARGADTIALAAACTALAGVRPPKLVVIVPKRLKDQPVEAQEWARECADEILELQLPRLDTEAYRRRNRELVARADVLVAFWDGRSGGTRMTIGLAEAAGIRVEIVPLLGASPSLGTPASGPFSPIAAFDAPWPHWLFGPTPSVGMPVVTLGSYMSAVEGLDRLSQFVRATKARTVNPSETRYWAEVAAAVISARPELRDAASIVPMPRRVPGQPNDMAEFVARISAETGKADGTGLLVRVEEPIGGKVRARRERFLAEEHARTMAVDFEHPVAYQLEPGSKVLLLDNVLAFGGTLEGARRTFARDLPGVDLMGFAALVSGDYVLA
jgi:hypothetical protein